MGDLFYRAFEDKFRGSRELVKSRLGVYLPFLTPLNNDKTPARAVDLGCGRGEWLELLSENGFVVQGVDLDDGMLEACRDLSLPVITGDALEFLRSLSNDSQDVVSAFHLVEHIPFDSVLELVGQALRVLKPGGLLILETPNPENLVVGTANFYLDPTHQRPLPPPLLAFIPEYAGFALTKILRLQESEALSRNLAPTLLDVLNGASPDYAIVAQKKGPTKLMKAMAPVFETEFGLTVETLANRHQNQTEARSARAEYSEAQALAQMQEACQELHNVHQANHNHWLQLEQTREELQAVLQANHHHWLLSEQRQQQIDALLGSSSWKITAPFRWPVHQFKLLRQHGLKRRLSALVKKLLRKFNDYLLSHPKLRRGLLRLSQKVGLYSKLKKLRDGLQEPSNTRPNQLGAEPTSHADLEQLTPHARRIYATLTQALEREKGQM